MCSGSKVTLRVIVSQAGEFDEEWEGEPFNIDRFPQTAVYEYVLVHRQEPNGLHDPDPMCVLTAVFLDVISSCEAVLSSSLEGLQLSFNELDDDENVFLVSFPKFNDNFGFLPTIGVPNVLHEGEGVLF